MPTRTSISLRARSIVSITALGGALALAGSLSTAAPVQAQAGRPVDLFNHTFDRKVITVQVRSALPTAIDGLERLVTATDVREAQQAVTLINNTYRYLRAAQESILLMHQQAKYPDPLAPVYAKRMWEVRAHLLKCLDTSGTLTPENPESVAMCAEELTEGIRKLRILVAIFP